MSTAIISLKYLEPEYQQTIDCIAASGFPVYYADRDGVGNMSRAFNEAFKNHIEGKGYEFVWFITNITFEPHVPAMLADWLSNDRTIAGIHPVMNNSDHLHLRDKGTGMAREVSFIEFTAPMFRTNYFSRYMLDENLWYYYQDLELCHRMKQDGFKVAVHDGCSIDHVYLRNSKTVHPVSDARKKLRDYISPLNKQYLNSKYGEGWEKLFGWKG